MTDPIAVLVLRHRITSADIEHEAQRYLRERMEQIVQNSDDTFTMLRKFVGKHIEGGNFAVAGDDEIGSRVLGRLARRAGHPTDPPPIADLLRRGYRLISKRGMSSLDL